MVAQARKVTKNFDTFAAAIAFQDGVNATLGLLGAVNVKVILGNILPLVDADKGYTTTITVEEDYPDNDRW